MREMPRYRESGVFTPLEKLVIEYAERMSMTPVEVSDAFFDKLLAHFDSAQMVELTAAIAWENYRARFDHAFGVEAQGFSEGAYCALPERPAVAHSASRAHSNQG